MDFTLDPPGQGLLTPRTPGHLLAIGGSTGVIEALGQLLPALPFDLACPVVVAVHIPPNQASLLASIFQARCRLPVHEAEDKEQLRDGHVYFAPPDYHLLIERGRTAALSIAPPVHFCRPSIDVLFESVAWAQGSSATAVALTGANEDGAAGLLSVARAGGTAWVQQPEEAVCDVLPRAALGRVPAAKVMTLEAMAAALKTIVPPTGDAVPRQGSAGERGAGEP